MTVKEEIGVIVLLDALGTKGIWNRIPNINKYVDAWEHITESWKKNLEQPDKENNFQTKLIAFSDTIILKNTGTNIDDVFTSSAHNASLLMLESISKGIFFRGCISVGKIFSSDKIIIGNAIDEAAEYYNLPNWVGLSASPSAYNTCQKLRKEKKLENKYDKDLFIDYDIPLKVGNEKGISINIASRLDLQWGENIYKNLFGFSTKQELIDIFQKELETLTNLSASLKIRNTIEFFKYVSTL